MNSDQTFKWALPDRTNNPKCFNLCILDPINIIPSQIVILNDITNTICALIAKLQLAMMPATLGAVCRSDGLYVEYNANGAGINLGSVVIVTTLTIFPSLTGRFFDGILTGGLPQQLHALPALQPT